MAQPLYFLPSIRLAQLAPHGTLSRAILNERGIADVFADVASTSKDASACELSGLGPGEKSGVIITYQTPSGELPRRLGYYPEEQEWKEVSGGLWLGIDKAERPTPEDMRRKSQYPGYSVELGDEHAWSVPVIRRPDGSTELPTDLYWDEAGITREPVKAAYEQFWEATEDVAALFFGSAEYGGEDFPASKALALCVDALSINYRFGRNEQNRLRVIDGMNCLTVLGCTVDVPKFQAIEEAEAKKKLLEANGQQNSTPGQEADSQATDRVEATLS